MKSVSKNTIFGLKMKNYGEKWSWKIYFEISPCGKMVIFITAQTAKMADFIFQNMAYRATVYRTGHYIIVLDTDSILRVKTMYESVK